MALRQILENVRFLVSHMLGTIEATAVDKFYYGYVFAQGRDFVAAELHCDDPFRLASLDIVERVLAAGYTPSVDSESRYPVATSGRVERIDHLQQRFIVSVDPVAETLSVQEIRDEPYGREGRQTATTAGHASAAGEVAKGATPAA